MFNYFESIEPKRCNKCGSEMVRIHRRYSKRWIGKFLDEISAAKGDVEFEIKSGRYQYCVWYCPSCDKI